MEWFGLILVLSTFSSVRLLRCACNTQHCRSTGSRSCATQYKCYIQYLDKRDGSNPVTTGCISGKTPLLCENRLPAVTNAKWPYLVCCDIGDLCNSGVIPSPPPWSPPSDNNTTVEVPKGAWSSHSASPGRHRLLAAILDQPLVLAVLVVGVVLLAGIVGFGFLVLKKQSLLLQQAAAARCTKTATTEPDATAAASDANPV